MLRHRVAEGLRCRGLLLKIRIAPEAEIVEFWLLQSLRS